MNSEGELASSVRVREATVSGREPIEFGHFVKASIIGGSFSSLSRAKRFAGSKRLRSSLSRELRSNQDDEWGRAQSGIRHAFGPQAGIGRIEFVPPQV